MWKSQVSRLFRGRFLVDIGECFFYFPEWKTGEETKFEKLPSFFIADFRQKRFRCSSGKFSTRLSKFHCSTSSRELSTTLRKEFQRTYLQDIVVKSEIYFSPTNNLVEQSFEEKLNGSRIWAKKHQAGLWKLYLVRSDKPFGNYSLFRKSDTYQVIKQKIFLMVIKMAFYTQDDGLSKYYLVKKILYLFKLWAIFVQMSSVKRSAELLSVKGNNLSKEDFEKKWLYGFGLWAKNFRPGH